VIVIPRKKGEGVVIGEGVTVTVVEIRGDKVRLQVEAPKEATVHRKEVYDAVYGVGGVDRLESFDPGLFP
jgi:carbon storage regulator